VRWYTAALMRINGLYGKAEFRKLVSLAARRRLRLPGGTRV
jgi:hypothetical protein